MEYKVKCPCGNEFVTERHNRKWCDECLEALTKKKKGVTRPSAERVPLMAFLRQIEKYNREHGTCYSYGRYVLKVEGNK